MEFPLMKLWLHYWAAYENWTSNAMSFLRPDQLCRDMRSIWQTCSNNGQIEILLLIQGLERKNFRNHFDANLRAWQDFSLVSWGCRANIFLCSTKSNHKWFHWCNFCCHWRVIVILRRTFFRTCGPSGVVSCYNSNFGIIQERAEQLYVIFSRSPRSTAFTGSICPDP